MSHTERALSFGQAADLYDRARPSYPAQLVREVLDLTENHPSNPVLVDLAAGTGKLTSVLTQFSSNVTAVEPDPEMRAQLRRALPDVIALDGRDSAIPLPDSSVDALFVAQAWHWFNEAAAAAEILRVLRSGGVLAVLWNLKDDTVGWVNDFRVVIGSSSTVSAPLEAPSIPWSAPTEVTFPWEWTRTRAEIVEYGLSTSYCISLSPSERAAVTARLVEITEAAARTTAPDAASATTAAAAASTSTIRETLAMPFVTRAFVYRAPSA